MKDNNTREKAILVGVKLPDQKDGEAVAHLEELASLTHTAGADMLGMVMQALPHPHPKYVLGSGKIKELAERVKEEKADMVIFDCELSPTQIRNLETILDCKILDRSNLILDIFAMRAQTAQAKAQVEMAQHEYLLPRLTKMWTHLSRQKGGIGMKGPGEKEIETDRRIIRYKMSLLKEKLAQFDKQSQTRRKSRDAKVKVALVGYTNAGKSTLMNALTSAGILAEDKLFATLDTTVRKMVWEGVPFLITDTVGFIRKLPHALVESFKSTLDEVRDADILLHIVDAGHPESQEQIDTVNATLQEIGIEGKPIIMVYNKIDSIEEREEAPQDWPMNIEFTGTSTTWEDIDRASPIYVSSGDISEVKISARERIGLDELRKVLIQKIIETSARIYPQIIHNPNPDFSE